MQLLAAVAVVGNARGVVVSLVGADGRRAEAFFGAPISSFATLTLKPAEMMPRRVATSAGRVLEPKAIVELRTKIFPVHAQYARTFGIS